MKIESTQQDWVYKDACEDRVLKVKEDLVKTKKKRKNPSSSCLIINMIVGFIVLVLMLGFIIRKFSLPRIAVSPGKVHQVFLKEDLVKTKKKRSVDITEEPIERNHKNPSSSCLIINRIVGFSVLLLMLEFIIRKFSLQRIAVSPGKVHQVFLNFRGVQLRHNYVSHLGHALQRNGIKFFIDEDEQKGEDLDNIFVRIEESRIALAIFSTRYSESKWCMNELVKMKKLADLKELRVIPIFYKVEAEDVKRPKEDSEFGKNFWKLAQDSSSTGDDIKNWKEALECISKKAGFSVDGKSSESDSIEKIVKALQSILGMKKIKEKGWELQLRI